MDDRVKMLNKGLKAHKIISAILIVMCAAFQGPN